MEIDPMPAPAWPPASSPEFLLADHLRRVIAIFNERKLLGEDTELRLVLSPGSLRMVVNVVDPQSNEIIQRIPPAYLLRIARNLHLLTDAR